MLFEVMFFLISMVLATFHEKIKFRGSPRADFENLELFRKFLQKSCIKTPFLTLSYSYLLYDNKLYYIMCVTPQAFDFPYPKFSSPKWQLCTQIYSICGDIIIGTFIRDKWENRKTMNKGNKHDSLCL